jgi:hypothetical protein
VMADDRFTGALRDLSLHIGAGDGNRTRMASLDLGSTVGVAL